MSLYAQYRLVWRPATILQLLPLFWAVVWPLLMISSDNPGGPRPVEALWLASVAIPGSIAFVLAFSRTELVASLTAFTLPDANRKLLIANLQTAVAAALAVGAMMAIIAGPVPAIVVMLLGIASYAVGTLLADEATPSPQRALVAAVAGVMVWKSAAVGAWLVELPVVAIGMAIAGLLALRSVFSRATLRRRPFGMLRGGAHGSDSSWRMWRPSREQWSTSLATERLAAHLGGVMHSAFGHPMNLARIHLLQAAFGVVAVRLLGDPFFLAFVAAFQMVLHGILASQRQFMPVGRALRARLAWTGALASVAMFLGLVAVLWPLSALIPEGSWMDSGRRYDIIVVLGSIFATAPVAQWAPIRWGPMLVKGSVSAKPWVAALLCTLGARAVGEIAIEVVGPGLDSLLLLAPLAIAMQLLFWVAIKRHYQTADLIPR